MPADEPLLRRSFLRGLSLAAPAALLNPAEASADEPKPDEPAKAPATEVDARMGLILQRYGHRLDAESIKVIRSDVESHVRRAEQLRKFPLDNGDAPYPVFTPYRAPLA